VLLKNGVLYSCYYSNYHKDKNPLLLVLYSDVYYTHGLNVHYLSKDEYKRLTNMLAKVKEDRKLKNKFIHLQRQFYYDHLKPFFKDAIDVSYRTYHTNMLVGIPAHALMFNQIGSKWTKYKGRKHREEIIKNNIKPFTNQLKVSIQNEKKALRRAYGKRK